MNRLTVTCIAAALVWASGAHVVKAQCPASQDARVSVEVTAAQVETAFDTSLPELERLARAAGREAHLPLMAVYSSSVLFVADIESRVEQTQARRSCAVAQSVRVRIAIGQRTIHAARELRDKPCLRTAAIDHAATHARHQEERLPAAREIIAASLKASLRAPAPDADSAIEAERALAQKINARIDAELAGIDADKTETNRVLDSAESLARLKAACPNERAGVGDDRT
ncbi:MAG: hypothetical protein KGM42_00065 [Hyphomicrobiales bacterium]|nr:hypothetical protein [Hyphomicrobiales bacterium]